MKRLLKRLLILLCSIAVMAPSAYAQKKEIDYEFDNEKPWVEIQAELPPYPQTENLLKFDAGPASDNSHYVDAPSISVGEDAVVRFTLVIKSPSGAMNVSYEGIRCQTAEKRTYAYGRKQSYLDAGPNVEMDQPRKYYPELSATNALPVFFLPTRV